MKKTGIIFSTCLLAFVLSLGGNVNLYSCSTFKLQKGNQLIFGHNLNEGDIGVPGMIFINKRGIFKCGRSWSELYTKEGTNPSTYRWISRYGSVSFNNFGKDFPDGGMNETGLYIWEMNESADYPQDTTLPKLFMMNWIQYVLDNCYSLDEVIQSASQFKIDGWTWHYFISDGTGNCAALAFINGKVNVTRGAAMIIPALFNEPYNRELELLRYYKGFGGLYEINLNDPKVPRFVKAAAMIRDYDPSTDAVKYGFNMLEKIAVNDIPEWSVIFDAGRRNIYFKTRLNPVIKMFAMDGCDFSNGSPVQILDIDMKEGGEISRRFHPYSNDEMKTFLEKKLIPLVPEQFFTGGGLTVREFADRFSCHGDKSKKPELQYFTGVWKTKPESKDDVVWELKFTVIQDAVHGEISNSKGSASRTPVEHLVMNGDSFVFTFRTDKGTLYEFKCNIRNNQLYATVLGIENNYGEVVFTKSGTEGI
jgi:penicillin V acylase-like amidase (Ntn superfamily)